MENFKLSTLKELSVKDGKAYITKYFFPLTTGNHAFLKDGKYEIMPHEVLTRVYMNRFSKDYKIFYMNVYDKIVTPVYKLNKPVLYDDNLNLCTQLPEAKPFKSLPKKDQEGAMLYFDYMKEVLCSGKEPLYKHLMGWSANVCKGVKNDAALSLKTNAQGVGKSTYPQMMMLYVLPKDLTLESPSEPLKCKFNSILGGKIFVAFEELESVSSGEWIAMSNVLKRQITSPLITLEGKGTNSYETDNLNNYCLLSNHDTQDDGRRFFVLDISTHRKGDRAYWTKLYNTCFNKDVGYAIYCYLREYDTNNFVPQDFPETASKLSSISKRLDNVYNFLKYEFVLKNKDINMSLTEIMEYYNAYCTQHQIKKTGKIGFNEKMKEIGFEYIRKKKDGVQYNKYIISCEKLLNVAKCNHWIHELDEFEPKLKKCDYEDFERVSQKEHNVMMRENEQNKLLIKNLQKTIDLLENEKRERKMKKKNKHKRDQITKQYINTLEQLDFDDDYDYYLDDDIIDETKYNNLFDFDDGPIKPKDKKEKKHNKDKSMKKAKTILNMPIEDFDISNDDNDELNMDDIEAMF